MNIIKNNPNQIFNNQDCISYTVNSEAQNLSFLSFFSSFLKKFLNH